MQVMIDCAEMFVDMNMPAEMPSSQAGVAFGSASRFSRARASCSNLASGLVMATSIKKFLFCMTILWSCLVFMGGGMLKSLNAWPNVKLTGSLRRAEFGLCF